jgi:hypothetical protein
MTRNRLGTLFEVIEHEFIVDFLTRHGKRHQVPRYVLLQRKPLLCAKLLYNNLDKSKGHQRISASLLNLSLNEPSIPSNQIDQLLII